jgi:phytoene synthase
MSVTASLVQKVGCENVKISCEATDLGYVTARNWWAYASWGQSIAPAVNCLNELCNPNLATGRSDNFLGDWDWNGAANDAFLSNPSDALTSRDPREIDVAYKQCEDVTKTFSKTFYIGTAFMAPAERKHAWAIYAWCRRTDDIVDSPHAQLNPTVLDRDLEEWNRRLDLIWDHRSMDMFDLAMADTVRAYPTMDIQPYRDMIKGMIMDVPGHPEGKRRYETFEELYTYCYRVAGTVGMMMLPILGAAPEFTEEQAKKPAVALGIALQLTNILRDVGEDLKRGRIYLPQEDLRAFGITQKELLAGKVTDKYRNFVKFQIARARGYYKEAAKGIPMLAPDARFAVRASLDLYGRILDKIEENDYDNFNKRAFTTGLEKLSILPGSWMKSLQKPEKVQDSAVCNDPMCKDPLMKQVQLVSSPQNSTSWSEGSMSMAVAGFAAGAVVAFAVALRRRRPTGSEVALLG